jgi:hypothetical protein
VGSFTDFSNAEELITKASVSDTLLEGKVASDQNYEIVLVTPVALVPNPGSIIGNSRKCKDSPHYFDPATSPSTRNSSEIQHAIMKETNLKCPSIQG